MSTLEEIIGRAPTEEEAQAWAVLGGYFKTPEQIEQGRAERDAEISKIVDDTERQVAEAREKAERAKEDAQHGINEVRQSTPSGPVMCPKCRKPALILDRNNGFKVSDFKTGKELMNYGDNVQMIGNTFGFGCPYCAGKSKRTKNKDGKKEIKRDKQVTIKVVS